MEKQCQNLPNIQLICLFPYRVVSAKLHLTLRGNKKKSSKLTSHNWSVLKHDAVISKNFVTTVFYRFNALQDPQTDHSSNDTYYNFETACWEAAADTIPHKTKSKENLGTTSSSVKNVNCYIKLCKDSVPSPEMQVSSMKRSLPWKRLITPNRPDT